MQDRYSQLVNNRVGELIMRQLGLPRPEPLDRYQESQPVISGLVLLGAAPGGRLARPVARVLAAIDAEVATRLDEPERPAVAEAGISAGVFNPAAPGGQRAKALVFDASGIGDSSELVELHRFFHGTVPTLERSGRVIVLGTPPQDTGGARRHVAQRALEGFTRSLGKEVGRGSTVQLVYVAPGAETGIESTLRFLLSPRSAYVSGEVVRITGGAEATIDWDCPLRGRTALVTGASRGIGASIAETLARDGAHVVGLDVAQAGDDLRAVTGAIGGEAFELDITDEQAPEAIARRFSDGLDVVVHNAGITRDRTIAKMPEDRWTTLMEVNLSSEERMNDALLEGGVLRPDGRIVCVSSLNGIAGARGQTNYATSKAGVIGMVEALAPVVAEKGLTINAVAPGFIETQMTRAMPFAMREAGRRMNSLSQGGLPVDVAEAIAWLASPASGGLNGVVVGVGGQTLVGAA